VSEIESRPLEWEALVAVGRVARPIGRRGEIAVDPWTSAPERFRGLSRVLVRAADRGAPPTAYRVLGLRIHKGRPVLKLEGFESMDDAEKLREAELRVPEADLEALPQGSFYQFQIQGLSVVDRRQGNIGIVESVLETGGIDLLMVRGAGGEETLVPLCDEIVKNVDLSRGSVEIDAPEGLVSLNAD
jgi:16S rRNA processing protein RimM